MYAHEKTFMVGPDEPVMDSSCFELISREHASGMYMYKMYTHMNK